MFGQQRHLSILGAVFLGLILTGCDSVVEDEQNSTPAQVSVMPLVPKDLLITRDLPGRVTAVRSAEIRAQVGGIVKQRLFEQGTQIKAGAVLFQINPAPFKAELDSASATLQRAEAVFMKARRDAERVTYLVNASLVSRQAFDDAVSVRDQAAADLAQAKAAFARRKLDLEFASVQAPISGRIDQALVSEGSLVSPIDTTPMARIQQIDQVYVDIRLPASALESMRKNALSTQPDLLVEILSSDGKPLGMKGRILFSGIEVDSGTGNVLLRVLVDNPEYRLLPGLYVQARIPLANYPNTLSIPQQAVFRVDGKTKVWVLDQQNRSQQAIVELGELVEQNYRVLSGVVAGQKIVIEGIEKLSPGAQVASHIWPANAISQTDQR